MIKENAMQCKHCGAPLPDNAPICDSCGTPANMRSYAPGAGLYVDLPVLPMKWFRFLINFFLFFAALLYATAGTVQLIKVLAGVADGSYTEIMYEQYSHMMYIDIATGCGLLICCLLALVTRFRLAGYSKDGIVLLNSTFIFTSGISIIRMVGMSFILSEETFSMTDITSTLIAFIVSMILVLFNTVYFKKRIYYFGR